MFGLSPTELLVVGVVAVLLFGSRLPSVARSAGKSLTEFRRGLNDLQHDFRESMRESETATPTPAEGAQARLPRAAEGGAPIGRDDSADDTVHDPYKPEARAESEAAVDPEAETVDATTHDASLDPDRDRREASEPA